MLSDHDILWARGRDDLDITPWDAEMVQPASIDVRLGNQFLYLHHMGSPLELDPARDNSEEFYPMVAEDKFILHPGDFVLASTVETIKLSDRIAARVEGKSSLGRLGLLTHITAGFIDPGFEGQITLELSNVTTRPIILHVGMKIAQVCFTRMESPSIRPYGSALVGSHYQGQTGPQVSRSHENFYRMQ